MKNLLLLLIATIIASCDNCLPKTFVSKRQISSFQASIIDSGLSAYSKQDTVFNLSKFKQIEDNLWTDEKFFLIFQEGKIEIYKFETLSTNTICKTTYYEN